MAWLQFNPHAGSRSEIKIVVWVPDAKIEQYLTGCNRSHTADASTGMAGRPGHVQIFQRSAIIRIIRKRPERAHLRKRALAAGGYTALKTPVGARQAGARLHVFGDDVVRVHIGGVIL